MSSALQSKLNAAAALGIGRHALICRIEGVAQAHSCAKVACSLIAFVADLSSVRIADDVVERQRIRRMPNMGSSSMFTHSAAVE
jgi:hypothetical protein